MKRPLVFSTLCTSLLVLWLSTALGQEQKEQKQPKEQKDPNPIVLRVGKEEIRADEVTAMLEALPQQFRYYYRTTGRRKFADYIVNMKVLAAEGERRKVDQQPRTHLALEMARASILADAAAREIESSVQVSPTEIEQYYKDHMQEFEKVHVRHIRIRAASSFSSQPEAPRSAPIPTDEEAQKKLEEIRKRVVAGEDFAELARLYSDDLETAAQGGDAGWIGPGEKMPLDRALTLKPGELSPVFPGPYGFELIRAEERRTLSLDEVRSQIGQILRRTKTEEAIKQIREGLHPVIDEEFFKSTTSQQAPPQSLSQTAPKAPTR